MVKKARARYEGGKLVMLDGAQAPPEGSEVVVTYRSEDMASQGSIELYGSWAGKFPEGFDIDKELREIRSSWEKNLGA